MLDWVIQWDQAFFKSIHTFGQSEYLDFFMIWISGKFTWIPLYVGILFFLYKHYPKTWYFWVIGVLITFATTDMLAAKVIKPFFERPRPCHAFALTDWIHLPNGCGSKYGFVSNHAANTLGLTLFLWKACKKSSILKIVLSLYVLLTAWSRIYLGAHYPGDIVFGWLLAICISTLYQYFAIKKLKILP